MVEMCLLQSKQMVINSENMFLHMSSRILQKQKVCGVKMEFYVMLFMQKVTIFVNVIFVVWWAFKVVYI